MAIFDSMKINTSALNLERMKLDVISSNIANVNTTRTEDGGPYLSKMVTFEESIKNTESFSNVHSGKMSTHSLMTTTNKGHLSTSLETGAVSGKKSFGVRATGIIENEENLRMQYDPSHPNADEEGYVTYPNVDMADEMIDLMNTLRSYEANVTAIDASKSMLKKALEISI